MPDPKSLLSQIQDELEWPDPAPRPRGPQERAAGQQVECGDLARRLLLAADHGFDRAHSQKIVEESWQLVLGLVEDSSQLGPIAVGAVISYDANGSAWMVPGGGGHVVTVNAGLLELLYNAGVTLAAFLANDSAKADSALRVASDELLALEMAINLRSYTGYGKQRTFPLFHPVPDLQLAMGATLAAVATVFVTAHEFGHCILGHLERRAEQLASAGKEETGAVERDFEEEHEADRVATQIVCHWILKNSDRLTQALGSSGLEMLFALLVVLEAETCNDPERGPTHPPARERWLESGRVFHGEPLNSSFLTQIADWVASAEPCLASSIEELCSRWNQTQERVERLTRNSDLP